MASKEESKTLEQTFKDTIDSATSRLKKYKADVGKFKGLVTEQTSRLQTLLQRLRDCIEKLKSLRDSYNNYNQRIVQVRQRISVLLSEARSEGSTKAGEECNEKIKGLIEKFRQLNAEIGDFDGDGAGLRKGLDDLSGIIKELCDETEGILGTMGETQTSINQEVSSLEQEVNATAQGASKSQSTSDNGAEENNSDEAEESSDTIETGASKFGEKLSDSEENVEENVEEEEQSERKFNSFDEFEAAFLGEVTKLKRLYPQYRLQGGEGSNHRNAIRSQLRVWVTDNSKGMTRNDHEMFSNVNTRNNWLNSEMKTVVFPPGTIQRGGKTRKRRKRGGWRKADENSPIRTTFTVKKMKKIMKKKKKKKSKKRNLKLKKTKKK